MDGGKKPKNLRLKQKTKETLIFPSIYYLFNGEEIVYIGQSTTPYSRVTNHIKNQQNWNGTKMDFDSYAIVEYDAKQLNAMEKIEIQKYTPKYNKQGKVGENGQCDLLADICPHGHIFGKDHDSKDSCDNCPRYRDCFDLYYQILMDS